MAVIGITGPIKHGKTTLALALGNLSKKSSHFESSLIIKEVADAMHEKLKSIPSSGNLASINDWLKSLPPILREKTHTSVGMESVQIDPRQFVEHPLDYEKLLLHLQNMQSKPYLAKKAITDTNKQEYRPFLQWLGGYLVKKVDAGIWYKEIARRIDHAQSDGAELCIAAGVRFPTEATILRDIDGVIVNIYRPDQPMIDMNDPTERERVKIIPDTTIVNDDTVDNLHRTAGLLLRDLNSQQLKLTYKVSELFGQKL